MEVQGLRSVVRALSATLLAVTRAVDGSLQFKPAGIEPAIQSEPALSAYWEQRDQIEQDLRQERQG